MKYCACCFNQKPLTEFAYKNKQRGILMSYCKECNRVYQKQHYILNRVQYIQKHRKYVSKIDENNRRKMRDYLFLHPCIDCGEKDIRVLEFDHILPKRHNVSTLLSGSVSWEKILGEIDRCVVRCANCHKRHTSEQFGWYKSSLSKAPSSSG